MGEAEKGTTVRRIFEGARPVRKISASWAGLRAEINTMELQAPARSELCVPGHTLLGVIQGGVPSVTVKADGVPEWQGPKLIGAAGFFPAGRPMVSHWPAATELTYLVMFVEPDVTRELLECRTGVLWRTRPEAGDPFLSAGLAKLARVLSRDRTDPLTDLLAETLATTIHLHLAERFSDLSGPEIGLADDGIERVLDLILDEMPRAVPLAQMVAVSGLPRGRFLIAFRRRTGTSPHQFILHERLARARAILETTKRSVGDVAVEVGFANAGALSDLFRQRLGISPQAWRRGRDRFQQ